MNDIRYVPILKGREGEYAALSELDSATRRIVLPLIEVPSIPFDFLSDAPAKTLDAHVDPIPEKLAKCWGTTNPIMIDMPWFDPSERLSDGSTALSRVLAGCVNADVVAIPVVSRTSPQDYVETAALHAETNQTGVCLRLEEQDFADEVDIESEIEALLQNLGEIEPGNVDILVDLDELGQNTSRASLVARYVLKALPASGWRRTILAAASFPEDLSDVDARSVRVLPRLEWNLWTGLATWIASKLPNLVFGDYAIAHPKIRELDPRRMRMSANIRYTTSEAWLILKGRNVRQHGFEQYFDLCRALLERSEYCGREFSWGDRYIADCAAGSTGPGNATTWRKVGTNHHITLVARTLATQRVGA